MPADWKEGVGSFQLEITGGGTNFVESHDVRIGDPTNKVGPLEVADVYPDGKILIKGISHSCRWPASTGEIHQCRPEDGSLLL